MGDISHGPVSTLPGAQRDLPDGAMCDEHPKRKAVARIQGETDSFGCEYWDVCQECLDGIRAYNRSAEARTGNCEWCKKLATDLRNARDYDEGMAGRVYRVCGECIRRRDEAAEEELRASGHYDDWDDSDDYEADEPEDLVFEAQEPPAVKRIPAICKRCSGPWAPGHRCRSRRTREL